MEHLVKLYELHPHLRVSCDNNLCIDKETGVLGRDKNLLLRRSYNMKDKINKHIDFIVSRVEKNGGSGIKKYQISGYYEYNILKNKLTHYDVSLIVDDKQTRNKVSAIIGSTHTTAFYDYDDDKLYFRHKKVPVMYVQINKK